MLYIWFTSGLHLAYSESKSGVSLTFTGMRTHLVSEFNSGAVERSKTWVRRTQDRAHTDSSLCEACSVSPSLRSASVIHMC